MPTLNVVSGSLLAATLLLPARVTSQSPVPEVRLGAADRSLPHQFTQIRGIRELPDGRLLVSDRLEPGIYAVDWKGNRLTRIGREGEGPAEYRLPGALVPFPGDSTLVIDEGNLRLIIIGPDLAIRRAFSNQRPGLVHAIYPRAVDSRGRFYFQVPAWASGPPGAPPPDLVVVARIDWKTGKVDTLARVKTAADPGPVKYGLPYIPFSPQDVWQAGSDGWLRIVRVSDYHLEIQSPDGHAIRGPAVPFTILPVTQADKIAYSRDFLENSTVAGRPGKNAGGSGMSAIPAEWLTPEEVARMAAENPFAQRKPPFTDLTPRLAPDGSVWVERSVAHGRPAAFDVFSSTGTLVRRVHLPARRRLLAVGAGGVYLAFSGDDGLETLERYPKP